MLSNVTNSLLTNAFVNKELVTFDSISFYYFRSLSFCSNKKNVLTFSSKVWDNLKGLLKVCDRLLKVDNMNPISVSGHRNGIHIIDLQQTVTYFQQALKVVSDFAAEGKNILFVGTKRQASEIIERYAIECNQFFINKRVC